MIDDPRTNGPQYGTVRAAEQADRPRFGSFQRTERGTRQYPSARDLNNSMTTAAFNAPANMADFLFQSTEIFLKPSAAGQVFKVDFPEIAQTSAVPEPSTLMMAAVALPLGIAPALRSRSHGLRNP